MALSTDNLSAYDLDINSSQGVERPAFPGLSHALVPRPPAAVSQLVGQQASVELPEGGGRIRQQPPGVVVLPPRQVGRDRRREEHHVAHRSPAPVLDDAGEVSVGEVPVLGDVRGADARIELDAIQVIGQVSPEPDGFEILDRDLEPLPRGADRFEANEWGLACRPRGGRGRRCVGRRDGWALRRNVFAGGAEQRKCRGG